MRDLLVLFHPFRNELNEVHNVKSITNLYNRHKNDIERRRREFEPNRELMKKMEDAIHDQEQNDDEDPDQELYDDSEESPEELAATRKELEEFSKLASKAQTKNRINISTRQAVCEMSRNLNRDQRRIFDDIIERLVSVQDDGRIEPFFIYVGGRAGTGKTFLMKTLIEAAKLVLMKSGDMVDKPNVLVLSPTASAALLINGDTIEGALPIRKSAKAAADCEESYESFGNAATAKLQLSQVQIIFIDEISMVGTNRLHEIHKCLNQLFGAHTDPFIGIPIICTGDFLQLSPVKDQWIFYETNPKLKRGESRAVYTAPNKWKLHFKLYRLTEKMRSIEDPEFSELCDNVGHGTLNEDDIRTLNSRIIPCELENENAAYIDGRLVIIVADNKRRDAINNEKTCLIRW